MSPPTFFALLVFAALAVGETAFTTCERKYKKIGCFAQSATIMQEQLVNDRDVTSKYFQNHILSWREFDKSLHSLACRCYEAAKKKGFTYFAIRYYGECHGGKDDEALSRLLKTGHGKSNNCVNVNFVTCTNHGEGTECAGGANAEYMYSVESKTDTNVDGGYGPWTPFSYCTQTCGQGVKIRERVCNNPVPKGDGKDCTAIGPSSEVVDCKDRDCPIHGGFSSWTLFNECSQTCGVGVSTRYRYCTNPRPEHGGMICVGWNQETKVCKNAECPINGGFTDWSVPSSCSVTCGKGIQTQTRTCTNPAPMHGGLDCDGDLEMTTVCTNNPCPVDGGLTAWSSYSACSKVCGDGTMKRTRTCTNPTPAHGGKDCTGSLVDEQACKLKECPIHGQWGSWSTYSTCSKTCGLGTALRKRGCTAPVPQHGGDNCVGDAEEIKQCKLKECPVNGYYSPWSLFSACSETCGDGRKTRSRTCTNPAPQHGGKDCARIGAAKETVHCKVIECPVDGGFTQWSEFSSCSQSCGIGSQERKRTCTNPPPQHNGQNCVGDTVEERQCKIKECPINGHWSPWSSFEDCSKSCGNGVTSRTRTCTNPAPKHGGKSCVGSSDESKTCKIVECPIDGGWTAFSPYGFCSQTCGVGVQERSRYCTNPVPSHGGDDCIGDAKETRFCKDKECPIDGGLSPWSAFSACSETCGNGIQNRQRTCTNPSPQHGGKGCTGNLKETRACKIKECPVNGGFTSWSTYGSCSKACGIGHQERTRSCTSPSPAHGGDDCVGETSETRQCKIKECPVNGGLSPWTEFGACDKTCGDGVETRTRTCTHPAPAHGGKNCVGRTLESRSCKVKECPVNGGFTEWSSYGTCSESCGHGTQERTRSCTNPAPAHGGLNCSEDVSQTRACKIKECPVDGKFSEWGAFAACSATCGGGVEQRTRTCTNPAPAHGGKACVGGKKETRACKVKECPVDGGFTTWSNYGSCSNPCGIGYQERTRSCTSPSPAHGGDDCVGQTSETRQCKIKECPVDGGFSDWSDFGGCSVTCGNGQQMRNRTCLNPKPAHGGKSCSGAFSETKSCNEKECPVNGGFTEWSSYGTCSESCGHGTQERTRSCTNPAPAHGGDDCVGDLSETKTCKVKECPVDGGFTQWSSFGACSLTCGDGLKHRHRACTNPTPAHGGKACTGPTVDTQSCKEKECPVDGVFTPWSSYTECSKTCGDGSQTRSRSCTNPAPAHGGQKCSGATTQSQLCNLRKCPVHGGFTTWSTYGACSELCGVGEQERTRSCTNPVPDHGGGECMGDFSQTRVCKIRECKINGGYSSWSRFTSCSKSCGEGTQSRTRACINSRLDCSGPSKNTRMCKVRECPVDGGLTSWTPFSGCSLTCGHGTQVRTRSCTNPAPAHGGKGCTGYLKQSRTCKERECPVHGRFTKWSSFTPCSETCGTGTRQRTRSCTNPAPAHGGKPCSGPTVYTQSCKVKECPVNGGLSQWSSYSRCSKTCGVGYQQRVRSCTKPRPAHGGKPCTGALKQTRGCKVKDCPVHGLWGSWGAYSDCSVTCGGGIRQKFRACNNPAPAHGGRTCYGSNRFVSVCNTKHCPVDGGFTSWSKYSRCSKACGMGNQVRRRTCTNPTPAHGGAACSGATSQSRTCKVKNCPVNGNWGNWGSYGSCSATCGGGVEERFRACNNPAPAHGGKKCVGSNRSVRVCSTNKCPVNGGFSSWSRYGACTKTCGPGIQTRTRSCTNPTPAHGGKPCYGGTSQRRNCLLRHCAVNGNWGGWSAFGSCSQKCGGGIQKAYRHCNNPRPSHGGVACKGGNTFVRACNTQKCAVNGNWGGWGPYGKCSATCGGGVQATYRSCNNPAPAYGGAQCPGSNKYVRACNTQNCPVNGKWGTWGTYGHCSAKCNGGVRERYRSCNNPAPAHGGAKCPGSNKYVQACNTQKCPVNGGFTSWSSYGSCSKSCGVGSQIRSRSCTNPRPAHGGRGCYGAVRQSRSCKVKECAVNGNWGNWGHYGSCSAHCNGGIRTRHRYCNNPAPSHGGGACYGASKMVQACNTHKCAVNGNWGNWGSYGACSAHCGGGIKKRFRHCNNPTPAHGGRNCGGSNTMVHACNTHKCAVNGNWGSWSAYGACSAKCNGGVKTRYRHCNNPAPSNGGRACAGGSTMVGACNTHKCTGWSGWGHWGACTLPCNGGIRFRMRNCFSYPCPGSTSMIGVCNMHRCTGK
ncbi:SCO-spondin-like isoform X2 [Hydractinia symbiolongicarpus]|uniref:SCO-spondin-like isoform X2 n=1 Tax=Hydractinia symbiolongicarpus TaxID=13093 RepID=UPI00254D9C1F|nr:SCO-spondin-like isoform X2 [Hydractinia symbiolongicarpus]